MTEEPGPDRRTQIVEAAFRCMASNGIAGLRMRDVAREAGVNIATVHYYLTSKAELIHAVVEHAHQQFAAHTSPPDGEEPIIRLRRHLVAVFGILQDDPTLARVLTEVAVESGHDPVVSRLVADAESRWRRAVRRMLRPLPARRAGPIAALVVLSVKGACLPPTDSGTIHAARRALDDSVTALAGDHVAR